MVPSGSKKQLWAKNASWALLNFCKLSVSMGMEFTPTLCSCVPALVLTLGLKSALQFTLQVSCQQVSPEYSLPLMLNKFSCTKHPLEQIVTEENAGWTCTGHSSKLMGAATGLQQAKIASATQHHMTKLQHVLASEDTTRWANLG